MTVSNGSNLHPNTVPKAKMYMATVSVKCVYDTSDEPKGLRLGDEAA